MTQPSKTIGNASFRAVNSNPFYYDQRKFAEITKRSEYRCLYDKSGKQQLEEMKEAQDEFDQRHLQLSSYCDKQADTVSFNIGKIEDSFGTGQQYDCGLFVAQNFDK